MAVPVLRDGVVKSHLMFFAPTLLPLEESETQEFSGALYLLAHECAHAEDLKLRDVCFPNTILQRPETDLESSLLERLSWSFWEEYAAYLLGHLDGLGEGLEAVPEVRALLETNPYAPRIERLHDTLSLLWARRGNWEALNEFDTLRDIARDALANGGLILEMLVNGSLYVHVPFRSESTW